MKLFNVHPMQRIDAARAESMGLPAAPPDWQWAFMLDGSGVFLTMLASRADTVTKDRSAKRAAANVYAVILDGVQEEK